MSKTETGQGPALPDWKVAVRIITTCMVRVKAGSQQEAIDHAVHGRTAANTSITGVSIETGDIEKVPATVGFGVRRG